MQGDLCWRRMGFWMLMSLIGCGPSYHHASLALTSSRWEVGVANTNWLVMKYAILAGRLRSVSVWSPSLKARVYSFYIPGALSSFFIRRAVLTIIIMRNLQEACSLALMTRTRWTTYEVRKDRQQY